MRTERSLPGYDGPVYRFLRIVTDLLYVNLLWLLACLPVVTAPAATAALFALTREWTKGRQPPIGPSFVQFIRDSARTSLAVGAVLAGAGAIIAADLLIAREIEAGGIVLRGALLVIGALVLATAVYAFPVMANYDAPWRTVLKNSALFALACPHVTLACLALVAAAVVVMLVAPVALAILGSATAWSVYKLCDHAFATVERREPDGAQVRA